MCSPLCRSRSADFVEGGASWVMLALRSPAGVFAGEYDGGEGRSLVAIAHLNGISSSPLYDELSTNVVGGKTRMTKEVHSSFTPEAVKTAE
ncbi:MULTISPECIES: hypothetical protein [unclassified Microcoleus]|uniref:hypothetical protein n=1 Tax=unclassified Microcoleus TaxID=2642155 RepID=UPI002FD17564